MRGIKTNKREGEGGGRTSVIIAAIAITMLVAVSAPFFFGGEDNEQVLGASSTVTISQTMTDADIETDIQTAIDGSSSGDKVTVTGSKTNAAGTLDLNIKSGVTVVWKAVFKDACCIDIVGAGTFEITDGADISSNQTDTIRARYGNVHVLVSGGTVKNTSPHDAIHYGPGGITVTGGWIESPSDYYEGTIFGNNGGNVIITGGTILATGNDGVAVYNDSGGDVTITGGTVNSTGDHGKTIHTGTSGIDGGDVIITGGTVSATGEDSYAIYMDDGSLLRYAEGTVFGEIYNGNGITEIIGAVVDDDDDEDSTTSAAVLVFIAAAALLVVCFAGFFIERRS